VAWDAGILSGTVKYLDRHLRDRRVGQIVRRIPPGARVLDVGCHDGALFRALGPALRDGLGMDDALLGPLTGDRYHLLPGSFPSELPSDAGEFDAITMAAVFEHIPTDEQAGVVKACWELLTDGGQVLLTVPSPLVDPLLDVLAAVRIIDGMEHHQHFGFKPADLTPLFTSHGFALAEHRTFQLGLNNLFIFAKPDGRPS
jgi:2-polyprenyl-3-methyl-5-hydroxy-6-metoxy-1,4-benzoquinol methylase